MSEIGYGYGSEWHLLRWLGYHRAELSTEVERAIARTSSDIDQTFGSIEWLDLAWNTKSYHLHWDTEWEGISFVKQSVLPDDIKAVVAQAWKDFWPSSGTAQCWDAVGVRQTENGLEWLLVEAKAHLLELSGGGNKAGNESRQKIQKAFILVQQALGIYSGTNAVVNDKLMHDWLGTFYQYANRLAALYFFNEYLPQYHNIALPARLINIYFIKESHNGWLTRQTEQEWSADIDNIYTQLGLTAQGATMRHSPQKSALLNHVHEMLRLRASKPPSSVYAVIMQKSSGL
ncbi:MAG: hypothetical protein ACRYFS_03155 [Janthinobacterium lividum]